MFFIDDYPTMLLHWVGGHTCTHSNHMDSSGKHPPGSVPGLGSGALWRAFGVTLIWQGRFTGWWSMADLAAAPAGLIVCEMPLDQRSTTMPDYRQAALLAALSCFGLTAVCLHKSYVKSHR